MPSNGHKWLPLFVLFGLAPLASAQEGPRPPEPTPEQIAAAEGQPLREQTIYIPFAKLRALFEKEGRGVFVPYEKFQELWKAARDAAKKIEDYKPPIGALIAEIDSTATVSKDVMNVEAKLSIEVLTEGWHEVPLRLCDAAIRSATIGTTPARILYSPETGYKLLLEKKGKGAERVVLALEYSKAFSKAPGTNSVQFDAPQAPVNRWTIRIPEAGVKVNVHPNLSASDGLTEMKPDEKPPAEAAKETLVRAFVGAAEQVRIDWTAKAEGAAGLAALATVQARQDVVIDEGVIRTRAVLTYEITRADVTQLVIEVPNDNTNIVNVFDPNVQKWEKKAEGPLQTITVTLYQPTRGTQNIALELEKFAGDKEMPQEMMNAELKMPVIRAVQVGNAGALTNVGRQQGVVVVRLGTALRGEVTSRTGLLQIDPADLPAPYAGQPWTYAYRYAALPFDLTVSIEKLLPQIEVEELVETYVEPSQITTNLLAILNIQRAGVFQVTLDVPEGYEIRAVQGREVAGAAAAQVDSHRLEEVDVALDPAKPNDKVKQKTKLIVNFARKALGKVGLWIELQRRADDPNLLAPTGKESDIKLPLPRVNPQSVARAAGRMIVYAPEALRLVPAETKGLRTISVGEALQGLESTRAGRFPGLAQLVAYAYTGEPASLLVKAQRRTPFIEVRQLLTVHVESGVVKYAATFFFDIRYSSVKLLRIDVPTALADRIQDESPNMHKAPMTPQPEVKSGYLAWQITGDGELLGSQVARFTWEKELGELPVGKGVAIDIPQLRPAGDRRWGQIAASKAETIEIDIDGKLDGLRQIDPQRDLHPGSEVAGIARAFEFHADDWSLALLATRYDLEAVKRTSIDRGLVRMVVTRGGQVAVQALYRLRSAQQRIAIVLPGVDPASADSTSRALDAQALRINNQSVPLEKDQKQFFIPLVGHSASDDVLVEIRYTVEGTAANLELPQFVDNPAVQQVYLAAYLPEERTLLGVRGPWTDETSSTFIDRRWRPAAPDDNTLLHQVRGGVANCETAGDNFPTDGTRYLFSALRPDAGPDGALKLTALHRNVVHVGVFLLVAIVGLVLTPRPIGERLWFLAGLVVLLVLLAVFAPALASAVLGDALRYALLLVLLVWLVRFLAWALPKVVQWISTRPASAARSATVAVAVAAAPSATPPPPPTPPAAVAGESPFQSPPAVPPSGQEGGPSNG
ncbi:MAG: hypothetical protein SFU86_11015 [Pirellulaceae bacterium]|nr:hypothetical protein [Pirellulaceae bacterium]